MSLKLLLQCCWWQINLFLQGIQLTANCTEAQKGHKERKKSDEEATLEHDVLEHAGKNYTYLPPIHRYITKRMIVMLLIIHEEVKIDLSGFSGTCQPPVANISRGKSKLKPTQISHNPTPLRARRKIKKNLILALKRGFHTVICRSYYCSQLLANKDG